MNRIKKVCPPTEIRSIDESSRIIEFAASTEAKDRYGDVIRVKGWKTEAFMRNPVFLFSHRSGDPPIGHVVDIRKESNPPALVTQVQFATKDEYAFGDTIYRLFKSKHMNAVSVGFMPKKQQPLVNEDGERTGGTEYQEQELLELSAVAVPANPEALARMVTRGVVTKAEADELVEKSGAEKTDDAKDAELIKVLDGIERLLRTTSEVIAWADKTTAAIASRRAANQQAAVISTTAELMAALTGQE